LTTKLDNLAVFTHSIVHRTASFFIVGLAVFFYLKQFKFVSRFYREFFVQAEVSMHSPTYILAIKTSLILGLIAGFLVVCLTIYTLVDVWGLKIIVTECSVSVFNTLCPFPGTGEMSCSEIVELRKGTFRFHLVGEKSVLSFSGVDRIDRLFYLISECKRRSTSKRSEK